MSVGLAKNSTNSRHVFNGESKHDEIHGSFAWNVVILKKSIHYLERKDFNGFVTKCFASWQSLVCGDEWYQAPCWIRTSLMIFFYFTKKEEDYKKITCSKIFFSIKQTQFLPSEPNFSHKIGATNDVILGSHGRGLWSLEPGALHFLGGSPK